MGTLLLVLLAQTVSEPSRAQVPIAIVVSSRRDTGNTLSSALCAKLREALAAEGVSAMTEQQSVDRLARLGGVDPHACDGSKLCLAKLAELLQGIVIGVDIGKVQRFSAGHLEAVAVGRVDSVAVSDFTGDAKGWAKKSVEETHAFIAQLTPVVRELSRALQPAEPPKVAVVETPRPVVVEPPKVMEPPKVAAVDAPKAVTLVPDRTPPPAAAQVEAPHARGPTPYVFAGAAVAVAAVAVTMLVLASADARRYHDSENTLNMAMTSSLSRAELSGLASSANLKYSVALGTGIGAVILGAVAGFLFAREP